MTGGLNEKKGLRQARRLKKGAGAHKRRQTLRHKEKRLNKHIASHPMDYCAAKSLRKTQAAY